jgi:hypothetical protein
VKSIGLKDRRNWVQIKAGARRRPRCVGSTHSSVQKVKENAPCPMTCLYNHRLTNMQIYLQPFRAVERGWKAQLPGRFTPRKDQVPVTQETGRARKINPPSRHLIFGPSSPSRYANCYVGHHQAVSRRSRGAVWEVDTDLHLMRRLTVAEVFMAWCFFFVSDTCCLVRMVLLCDWTWSFNMYRPSFWLEDELRYRNLAWCKFVLREILRQ